jgi:hypothetical protein
MATRDAFVVRHCGMAAFPSDGFVAAGKLGERRLVMQALYDELSKPARISSLPVFAGGSLLALSHRCPLLLLPVIPQLIREGFWLGGSTVVSTEGSPGKVRALLIAVQNEPAMLVYGTIPFLLLVGFALLIARAKWKRWVTGHKEQRGS